MIHFCAEFPKTLLDFAESWAPDLRPLVQTVRYSRLPFRSEFSKAIIFSDLERVPGWKLVLGRRFARCFAMNPNPPPVLNDPNHFVRRFELLRQLHQRGINSFRVFRLHAIPDDLKFPVFLRSEIDHRGAISGLLNSQTELEQAMAGLSLLMRIRKRHLMVIEYCDCADGTGRFRKYSAMNVNGTLIPRHILFSHKWVTKKPDLVDEATVAEENDFIERFEHQAELAAIFHLAGIDYGRIDYGMKGGRLQVWEINTNPTVVPNREKINPQRMPSQSSSAARIADALLAIAR